MRVTTLPFPTEPRVDEQHVMLEVEVEPGSWRRLEVPRGANLREALLDAGISPYTRLTRSLNCGGRGLCATCGVDLLAGAPEPSHWHDRAAHAFSYPRLSCQITVDGPMRVALAHDKLVWGARRVGLRPGPT
jgi:ferredoxin